MNIRKVNTIFGYVFSLVGIAKIILCILAVLTIGTVLGNMFNGSISIEDDYIYYYIFGQIIGYTQLILLIGSIIMIIVNTKNGKTEVIVGYLLGLGAVATEFVSSSIIVVLIECTLYVKAGSKIIEKNGYDYRIMQKERKQTLKDIDWFYGNKDK